MARMNNRNIMIGLIGALYGKENRGKQIFQTRPDRSHQDKSKNINAKLMKKVSHTSTLLRKTIQIHLNDRHESYMHSRFTGKLMSILLKEDKIDINKKTIFSVNCQELEGFEFNRNALFKDTFLEQITTTRIDDEKLLVTIPSFIPKEQVLFPPHCTEAIIRLGTFKITPDFDLNIEGQFRETTIEFTKEETLVEETTWICNSLDLEEKFEVIVADIQFFYSINNLQKRMTLYNSKEYNPSMVVYAK